MRKNESEILRAVYDTAKGLHKAGVMDPLTLGELDRLCLVPIEPIAPIASIELPVKDAKITNRPEKPA